MSQLETNSIVGVAGGNTTINGATPTVDNIRGKNKIINGNFDVWQRGTSQSYSVNTNQYDTADRWMMRTTSSADVTISQQQFAIGQSDVANEPKYWLRWETTAHTTGPGILSQRIESVRTLAGQTATVSFYAKADVSRTAQVYFVQSFGTGGSPSADVTLTAENVSLTTSWQKFTYTFNIPSITGKLLGTNNDDFLELRFGTPESTCVIDIAQVQLEAGDVATSFETRSYGEELALCQRYYWTDQPYFLVMGRGMQNTGRPICMINHPVKMRALPSCTLSGTFSIIDLNYAGTPTYVTAQSNETHACFQANNTNIAAGGVQWLHAGVYSFDAEL